MQSFWYVYKVFGGAPSHRHYSYEAAEKEAQRLIDTIGGEYEILECVATIKPAPKYVVERPLTGQTSQYYIDGGDDDIPF